uniref:ZP domain-containing protein n=1 Tax=Heterorhabditis bacteriophora TaxID=37862 RepID=A0A1I7XHK1_HETBA
MFYLVIISYLLTFVHAIPVDNGVEGEPEIECGPTSITVNFNTRDTVMYLIYKAKHLIMVSTPLPFTNPFQGHVYVKGLFDQQECRNDEGGRQVAGIELSFDSCNVARTRSLNPRGVFVSATVIVSFHPQFITKVDRAYRIQCFYMEVDKTVSSDIEVSDLTTAFQTQVVPMPICKYDILSGGPTGESVKFATVGQQVYHKWTCDSETIDIFCAVVHSCTVDDGNGDTVQILDDQGCALDKFLLNNLEYPTDLMAGQEPNSECPRPECKEPQGFGAPKQQTQFSRVLRKRSTAFNNIIDVRTELNALEVLNEEVGIIVTHLRSGDITLEQ